jgi:hypothetical protein
VTTERTSDAPDSPEGDERPDGGEGPGPEDPSNRHERGGIEMEGGGGSGGSRTPDKMEVKPLNMPHRKSKVEEDIERIERGLKVRL